MTNATQPTTTQSLTIDVYPDDSCPNRARLQVKLNEQSFVGAALFCRNPVLLLSAIKDALENVVVGGRDQDAAVTACIDPVLKCLSERASRDGRFDLDQLANYPFAAGAFVVDLWDTLRQIETVQHVVTLRIGDILEHLEDKPEFARERIGFITEHKYARSKWGVAEKELAKLLTHSLMLQRRLHDIFQTEARRFSASTWPKYVGVTIASLGLAELLRTHHAGTDRGGLTFEQDSASYTMCHLINHLHSLRPVRSQWNMGRRTCAS